MSEERKQIGWCEREEGFYPIYKPHKGQIVTHAFILCKYCNVVIYHCTVPKLDSVGNVMKKIRSYDKA